MQQASKYFSKFGNTILKKGFHRSKETADVFDIDIEKTIVSDAFTYDKRK